MEDIRLSGLAVLEAAKGIFNGLCGWIMEIWGE
jgi:hypothetical protein